MLQAGTGGKNARLEIKKEILRRFERPPKGGNLIIGDIAANADDIAAAVALQRVWRQRMAYFYVKELKQEKLCHDQREEMRAGLHVDCEACASAGKKSADVESRNRKKAWKDTDMLLFKDFPRVQMSDRGDNWNERWQEALNLPNITEMDKGYRKTSLDAVYSDFVHTAVTYGRTIISEYFLHEYMKSVRPKHLGGVAGGKKYLWRGILFKLADGSKGPYGGSDEAAAKAAGHELRGASEYLRTGVGLCIPPMCLLDYKGFRMLAQALLPLSSTSMKMGSDDGGRTVLNSCPKLDRFTAAAAKQLGLREHIVGGRLRQEKVRDGASGVISYRKKNVDGQRLHAAADVEGHEGTDSRMYLLDLARAFPPEDPNATPHLSGMLSVSARVVVQKNGKGVPATVTKAQATLVDYDILYPDGNMERWTPAHLLRDLRLFIFYRLMRPEFVRDRGRAVLRKLDLPSDHVFPKVTVTNPMMFAIKCARSERTNNRSSTTKVTQHRYVAGTEGLVPSEAPLRRGRSKGNAYANAKPLPSVAETAGGRSPHAGAGGVSSSSPIGVGTYEIFDGEVDEGISLRDLGDDGNSSLSDGYDGGDGFGSRTGSFGAADQPVGGDAGRPTGGDAGQPAGGEAGGGGGGAKRDEPWNGKVVEFGGDLEASGDLYYEGFRRAEVEEDGEEMKRRGGEGYRPFFASITMDDGYNMADERMGGGVGCDGESARRALEESEEDTEGSDADLDSLPPRDILEGKRGKAESSGSGRPGQGTQEFARAGMLRRDSAMTTKGEESVQRLGSAAAGGAGSGGITIVSDEENSTTSSDGDAAEDNYTGFDTESANSSAFAAMASKRTGSELYDMAGQKTNASHHNIGNIPASSPGSFFGKAGGRGRYPPTPSTPSSSLSASGYDTFGARSPRSHHSFHPASPTGPHSMFPPAGAGFTSPVAVTTTRVAGGSGGNGGGGAGTGGSDVGRGGTTATMGFAAGVYDQFYKISLGGNVTFGSASELANHPPRPASAGKSRGRGSDVGGRGPNSPPPPGYARRHSGGSGGGGDSELGGDVDVSTAGYSAFIPMASTNSISSVQSSGRPVPGHGRSRSGTPPVAKIFGGKPEVAAPEGGGGANGDAKGRRPDKSRMWHNASGSFGSGSGGGTGKAKVGFLPPPSDYDTFIQNAPPTPSEQGSVGAYDSFRAGSDRSISSSHRSVPADGCKRPQLPEPPARSPVKSDWDRESKREPEPRCQPENTNAVVDKLAAGVDRVLGVKPTDKHPLYDSGDGGGGVNGNGGGGEDGGPVRLSPDALTAFSNADPDAKQRNKDVTEATQFLITVLVPATAKLLCSMSPATLSKIKLAPELHKYGINVRHIGLLRAYITPPAAQNFGHATAGAGKASTTIMRDRILVEVVVRTLKLVLRQFQRQWMKSEQSSSEQGMHLLVSQFLNLVTGNHKRCDLFWREDVTTGVCQRYGTVALTKSERAGLWTACSERPDLLRSIVKELVKVTGVRFKESVNQKLRNKKTKIVGYSFSMTDIRDIEAVVTPMAIYP